MGIYIGRGIGSSFDGDINLSANGDVELADSYDTIKSSVNFLIRTDKGQYRPDKRVGCDLGTFIGDNMQQDIYPVIEDTVKENITTFIMTPSDVRVDAVPVDYNVLGLFVTTRGQYVDQDGNLIESEVETLSYVYPFLSGEPTLINVS